MNVSGTHRHRFERLALIGGVAMGVAGATIESAHSLRPPAHTPVTAPSRQRHRPAGRDPQPVQVRRQSCPSLPLCGTVVALDPGHGGPDQGAHSASNLLEKDINLDIVLRVRNDLDRLGATVVTTRDTDTAVAPGADHRGELQARDDVSNRAGADVMVSIHSNANVHPEQQGTEVYQGRRASAASRRLAREIHDELDALPTRDNGVKSAGFWVLRHSRAPVVLTEIAYLTNPEDASHLADPAFRQQAADAIAGGIEGYLLARTH